MPSFWAFESFSFLLFHLCGVIEQHHALYPICLYSQCRDHVLTPLTCLHGVNTEVADFCHSDSIIPKYAIMSLQSSSCESVSASFMEWLQCSKLPLSREILINIIMHSNHTQIVTHGLCIVWHCIAWRRKCYSMHIYMRSVPKETTDREQQFWWLMKSEIKSYKDTEVTLILLHHICESEGWNKLLLSFVTLYSLQHKVPQLSMWSLHVVPVPVWVSPGSLLVQVVLLPLTLCLQG